MPRESTPEIQAKYDDELLKELELISDEFDTFGLPTLTEFYNYQRLLLMQLIENVHSLLHIHKTLIGDKKGVDLKSVTLSKELSVFSKRLESTKYEMALQKAKVKQLECSADVLKRDIDTLKEENSKLKCQVAYLKSESQSSKEQLEHKIRKLTVDNEELQGKLTFGKFKSKDAYTCDALEKYKIKEDIYKETIHQLEANNKAMLEEVLTLREMIVGEISSRQSLPANAEIVDTSAS